MQVYPALLSCARVRKPYTPWSSPRILLVAHSSRHVSTSPKLPSDGSKPAQTEAEPAPEQGAMSRRLSEMTEESVVTSSRRVGKIVEEAGFSKELKMRLEERIADATFRSENAGAFAQAALPTSAPKQAREIAAAHPWSGMESTSDAALRMLNDATRPMRVPARTPIIRGPPNKVDTGRPKSKLNTGIRLANARDKTSTYAFMKDSSLTDQEREKLRQEMKQRFAPAGRIAPATVQGLASLANERIEDAIARGQFKNLPRGQKIERDYNASSPFIDTTEYFMNKIIQKQEIVPPWIEKQQELVSTATRFRGRLRADWRRHVSRIIASKGGNLEYQVRMAEEYAFAEQLANPKKAKTERLNAVDHDGHVSQITLAGELKVAPNSEQSESLPDITDLDQEIEVMEQTFNDDGSLKSPSRRIVVRAERDDACLKPISNEGSQPPRQPSLRVFRDSDWEKTERAYLEAAIKNLNALTRSYNLMAPALARKPYFDLNRELKSCFADVAPQVPLAIRERALAPKIKSIEVIGHRPGSVMERLGSGNTAVVFDERKPQYGFKEFWRDLFTGSNKT